MAVRPLVTTGAALLSAGALVAATPALFVPNDEVKVAATAPAPATKSMTVEQLKLLASLQQISDAFFQGYGGFATGDQNGDCGADDAVCPAGFVGVPYLLIDEALPNTLIDNYFFETGFVGTARYILESAGVPEPVLGLIFEPVPTISGLIADGADALFPNTFVAGITRAFLVDYGGNLGFVGAINYVVDAIIQGTLTPTPGGEEEENGQQLTTAVTEEGEGDVTEAEGTDDTNVLASTTEKQQDNLVAKLSRTLGVGPSSTEIGTGTLVDVNTGTEEEAENSEDLAAGEVGTGAEDETAGSGTGVTTPVANTGGTTPVANTGGTTTTDPEGSTAPEGETGATPTGATTGNTTEVKTQPVNETKTETETEDTKTVDTKGGNKVTPGVIFETGHKGGGGSGGWINDTINTLKKAFNGGGKTTQKPADTNDGGADNGGSEGGGDE
ncbi:hypothetical protein KL864_33935 [Mycolicibacterium goodii]|uniref:hypothetical protein n=1 Tax=Mycolicibacterium goodii TaxID=134601 RepID=UPI001BDC95F2|nr:hypothetical protein [Mycolicibacterium goodii]MBU8820868.1 hypothetical protein [Mycolicibacterium goodii]